MTDKLSPAALEVMRRKPHDSQRCRPPHEILSDADRAYREGRINLQDYQQIAQALHKHKFQYSDGTLCLCGKTRRTDEQVRS